MKRVFVEAIGLIGPGLDGWNAARAVLAGVEPYEDRPIRLPPVALLPPAERRRAGTVVKLAMAAGVEALAQAERDPTDMAMVFASSAGDGDVIHDILTMLATPAREVSPTRFHNSVHNAPAGYWAVATGSRAPSISLGAFDGSFVAGLLEASVQAVVLDRPVTLIAYDAPYPEPLHSARPIASTFCVALVLTPARTERALTAFSVAMAEGASPVTRMADTALERLRVGSPAARALPLMAAIARGDRGAIHLDGIDVTVEPP